MAEQRFMVATGDGGKTLGAVVRGNLGVAWRKAKAMCRDGRVWLDGRNERDPATIVAAGAVLEIRSRQPRDHDDIEILHADRDVVVVNKPPQLLSVPAAERDEPSLVELVPAILRRKEGRSSPPLRVVHRLDRDTSGILLFARNAGAHRHLQQQFRQHTIERRYLALVYGSPQSRTITSELVPDRGDGLRGSIGRGRRVPYAKRAVTHVERVSTWTVGPEHWTGASPRSAFVALVACRLETGRQHQIRIHLSEMGHPVVGDAVYVRDYRGPMLRGFEPPRGRTLLHAERLGFEHPRSELNYRFHREPAPDFAAFVASLGVPEPRPE